MHISSITLERVCCQSGKLSFVRCVQGTNKTDVCSHIYFNTVTSNYFVKSSL